MNAINNAKARLASEGLKGETLAALVTDALAELRSSRGSIAAVREILRDHGLTGEGSSLSADVAVALSRASRRPVAPTRGDVVPVVDVDLGALTDYGVTPVRTGGPWPR